MNFSKSFKWLWFCFFWGFRLAIFGCSLMSPIPRSTPPHSSPPQTREPVSTPEHDDLRTVASEQLTEQGQSLLNQGNTEDAIRVFEQSMSLNPQNGQNYFFIAEAWLLKSNHLLAEEFNVLAEIYLKEDPEWMTRVLEQRRRIEKSME